MPIFLASSIDSFLNIIHLAKINQTTLPPELAKTMKTTIIGAFLLCFLSPIFAQTEIGGTINRYAKITDIDPCSAVLTTSSTPIFNVGDEVLLIQMQGAEINESNSGSFGDVENLGGAGNFERNEIVDITGNQVSLKYNLEHNYDVSGNVQLVDVPFFNEALVNEKLTAFPWNGDIGGVLALRANTLTLDAEIDVSEQGFRGGAVNVVSSDCSFLTNADAYTYSINNWRGAPKGEGIATVIAGKEQGRGPQANGGGGGNDHNSGGGGGANVTTAGDGGKQSVGGFGCDGDFPGKRGKAIEEEPERIFMGGGGGAGHTDNNGAGTSGGNGGGIVFLLADEIIGNEFSVLSNGETPNDGLPLGDGQGGGGGGGSIFIESVQIAGLHIEAKGGDGGNANNPSNRCFGPGGGGSGGRLISSFGLTDVDLSGGQPGINTTSSGQCSDPSNGADPGEDGVQSNFQIIPFSNIEVTEVEVLAQPVNTTTCEEGQVTFTFSLSGPGLAYQWQFNDGTGWQDVVPGPTVAGQNAASFTFFQVGLDMDGWEVRCLVTGQCTNDILSQAATLSVLPEVVADFSFASVGGGAIQFTNLSGNANGYLWDFGDMNTSDEENPLHTYATLGQYSVTLTVFTDCGDITTTQILNVVTPPAAEFSSDINEGCAPLTVEFFDESGGNVESWEWTFEGGFPNTSFEENPTVIFSDPGEYDVTLIATNSEGSDTVTFTSFVFVDGPPVLGFDVDIDLLTVQFINQSQNVNSDYFWEFGDMNTSDEVDPEHTYLSEGFFEVTLTASNGCGETSITQTVATGQFPLADFTSSFTGGCAPFEVQFTDISSGTNLSDWQWEFEGGVPAISTEQNPTVTYMEAGSYDVELTVFNSVGNNTMIFEDYIVVEPVPQPDYFYTINGLAVAFTNTSVGGTNYIWNFDDGEISSDFNPIHIYDEGGIYSVTLNAIEANCAAAISYEVFVDIQSSTDEEWLENILLFPNPTSGELYIQLPFSPAANGELNLKNINGQILRSEKIMNQKHRINISEFSSGIYFLEIISGGNVGVFRVVRE